MSSPTPAPARRRAALAPTRLPGKRRVAALLRAGAAVIAERGFAAATMSEIAARAEAPIGSLYRFFPNKDALADALMQRYGELIEAAFEKIACDRRATTPEAFADALLTSLAGLRGETQSAVVELLETRSDGSALRGELYRTYRRQIVRALLARADLPPQQAEDMAVVLLHNMKAMKSLDPRRDAGAIAELRAMTRLYLSSTLGE